ncbi:MAG: hypothetical protein OHK0052_21880 [Anaerolineales bacterium]
MRGIEERAQVLGGQVSLKSVPGSGTRVTLWVAHPSYNKGWQRMKSPLKILICDDQLVVREGLKAILGTVTGFEVIALAEDGAEAPLLVGDTMRNYGSSILSKLYLTDRTQAAILAIRHGLVG